MLLRSLCVALILIVFGTLEAKQETNSAKFEVNYTGSDFVDKLVYASENCRQSFIACGGISTFFSSIYTSITSDGRDASIWLGRWIEETMTVTPYVYWSEVVYLEMWTDDPATDYTGASAVVHGVVFWNFVDQVLDAALANRRDKIEISAPGWYGLHIDDVASLNPGIDTVNISLTATVLNVPGAEVGDVHLNYKVEP